MTTQQIRENQKVQQTDLDIIKPGQMLRRARENAGLSIPDVAAAIHLTAGMISDIENDDYSRAPKFVFVRGYLRSYAKFLGIPSDEIVSAFNQLGAIEPPSNRPVREFNLNTDLVVTESHIRWLTYIIVFTLLLLVIVWWYSTRSHIESVGEPLSIETVDKTKVAVASKASQSDEVNLQLDESEDDDFGE